MIPRIIHQIWIGPKKPPAFLGSWRDKNPDYEFRLWGDEEIKNLPLVNRHIYDAFDLETKNVWNGKADIARYEIMHRFGGVYFDADIECLRPLDESFLENDFFSCYVNEEWRGDRVNCSVIGTIPGHPILQLLIDKISLKKKIEQPSWKFYGPGMFTECIESSGVNVKIFPSYYFEPDFFEGNKYKGDFKPYGYHHWGETKKLYGKI